METLDEYSEAEEASQEIWHIVLLKKSRVYHQETAEYFDYPVLHDGIFLG